MDPKSPLYNYELSRIDVFNKIDEWIAKGYSYSWKKTPDNFKAEIILSTMDQDHITYGQLHEIIEGVRTSKMMGNANRGLSWILESFYLQWKEERNNDNNNR